LVKKEVKTNKEIEVAQNYFQPFLKKCFVPLLPTRYTAMMVLCILLKKVHTEKGMTVKMNIK